MNGRALDNALEARRRFGIVMVLDHQVRQLVVEIGLEVVDQLVDIYAAGFENSDRILVLGQRHQQMFECRVFVVALAGLRQGAVQTFFEIA